VRAVALGIGVTMIVGGIPLVTDSGWVGVILIVFGTAFVFATLIRMHDDDSAALENSGELDVENSDFEGYDRATRNTGRAKIRDSRFKRNPPVSPPPSQGGASSGD
jgi:hypothetical protein